MRDLLTKLSKARYPYEPLIAIEISRNKLLHNLTEFQKLAPNHSIAPVLKSNAYGHGLIEIAKVIEHERNHATAVDKESIPFLVVDSYFEAISLRSHGIKTPILIIGYTPPETIVRAKLKNISFTITSLDALRHLSELETPSWYKDFASGRIAFRMPFYPRKHRIHLKIDTGMRRQGILPSEIPVAIEILKSDGLLLLEGIASHLCDADNSDEAFTEKQIACWNKTVKQFKSVFPSLKYVHLSNTDGHRYSSETDANVSRLGIGLYGLIDGKTFQPELELKPIMQMKTILTSIKQLNAGETIGYSNTFRAEKNMTVATIPVGYYEGIDRRLSNAGTVLVGPERVPCPIIGRVSMNIASIDVSRVAGPKIGMEAVVISNKPEDVNSAFNIAKTSGTITYEVTTKIPAHLKRVVVG